MERTESSVASSSRSLEPVAATSSEESPPTDALPWTCASISRMNTPHSTAIAAPQPESLPLIYEYPTGVNNILTLPAELRNQIFTYIAEDTCLVLFDESKQQVPGLLLASRQTRAEYFPLLLSLASITATITNYHFEPLHLARTNLSKNLHFAFWSRKNVKILLRYTNIHPQEGVASLRRWVERSPRNYHLKYFYELDGYPTGVVISQLQAQRRFDLLRPHMECLILAGIKMKGGSRAQKEMASVWCRLIDEIRRMRILGVRDRLGSLSWRDLRP